MARASRVFLNLARISIGVVLLYFVVSRTQGFRSIGDLLSRVTVWMALAACFLVGTFVEAQRITVLLRAQGFQLPFPRACRVVMIAIFFGLVIPGGTGGDLIKFYYLAGDQKGRRLEVATSVLLDRAAGLYSLLFVVTVLALCNPTLLATVAVVRLLVVLAGLGVVGFAALALVSTSQRLRGSRLFSFVTTRMPFHAYARRFADTLHVFRARPRAVFGAILLSLAGYAVTCLVFLVVGRVAIPQASLQEVLLLGLLGMLANVLPVTPGGLGVGEAAAAALFRLAGYHGGASLILVWRAGMMVVALLGGLLYLLGPARVRLLSEEGPGAVALNNSLGREPE